MAWYEDRDEPCELVAKFMGDSGRTRIDHSPFDVVAWHGNYAPYKYDLRRFNTIGSISYDHPDPSIFLVLQSISDTPGVDDARLRDLPAALAGDAEHLPAALVSSQRRQRVHGADRRASTTPRASGFLPGGASLHNCMSAHGPDAATFERASRADTCRAGQDRRHHGLHVRDAAA